MASFIFSCPQCGRPMEVQEEWIGMEAKCPHCGQSITIAKPEQPPAPADVEQTAGQGEKQCRFRGESIKKEIVKFCETKKSIIVNIFLLLLAAGIVWLAVWYLKHYPRVSFWTIAPIVGITILANHGQIHKFITMMLCAGIIFWGLEVHHLNTFLRPTSSSTFQTKSYSNYRSEQHRESKISVNVTVTKWLAGYGDYWKYNCEYKLYADNQCVATRNSTSMSVSFNVKVDKGAALRAEMLPKNGFGGIAKTYEGPASWEDKITASYSGQNIKIECK